MTEPMIKSQLHNIKIIPLILKTRMTTFISNEAGFFKVKKGIIE